VVPQYLPDFVVNGVPTPGNVHSRGDGQHPEELSMTPSQALGPCFGITMPGPAGSRIAPLDHPAAISIHGKLLDGAGEPVGNGLVETWQQGPQGLGRCLTDPTGCYEIVTLAPRSGYLAALVFAEGLLRPVATRIYLVPRPGDPVLAAVPAERRSTLIAVPDGRQAYRFDIRLQGPGETVFFEF
jgi:protocatechuate 3,4-dioxygenase alpha subunit